MNPSEQIDQLIAGITDWRGKTFASIRKSILAADREIIEEWKWMGSPVWSRDEMIAVANAHKGKVKLTFAYGARLADPQKLFNAGLEGNVRRAIDFFEGDRINKPALKDLVRAAIDYNQANRRRKHPRPRGRKHGKASRRECTDPTRFPGGRPSFARPQSPRISRCTSSSACRPERAATR